jgi:hypothetical protein
MKEFYLNLLNNLDKLAGLKQLDKIRSIHGEDKAGLKNEINVLLDVLCRVSSQFPYISEVDQQKIITQAVISEEFHSLNGNTVYKWLVRHKDKFFKESHHQEGEEEKKGPPLTGEARAEKLKEWLEALANPQQLMISRVKVDPATEGKEWVSEVERKAVSTKPDPERHVYTAETLKERNDRIRGMQEKAFRDRNPGASEEEVKLFLETVKKHEVKIPSK